MSEETQAATKPVKDRDEAPAPANDGEQAREPSLDDVLSKYNEEKAASAPEPPRKGGQAQPAPAKKQGQDTDTETQNTLGIDPGEIGALKEAAREIQQQQFRKAMDGAVTTIRDVGGDALSRFDNGILEDALNGAAARDPRIGVAFSQRGTNPQGWNDVVAAVARDLSKRVSEAPDPQLSADREAARMSGRGNSSTTGSADDDPWKAENWKKLSPDEQARLMAEKGYNPNYQLP